MADHEFRIARRENLDIRGSRDDPRIDRQAQISTTGGNAVLATRQPATVWCKVKDMGTALPTG